MNSFPLSRLLSLLCCLALLPALPVQAAEAYKAGVQYERVDPPAPTQTGDDIEVLEIFWYGCPHCYQFESYLTDWKQTLPEGVQFRRLPAVFGDRWLPGAKAYYAQEVLGVTNETHMPLFRAIHDQRRRWNDEDRMAEIFAENGVAETDFRQAYNSFANDSKTRQAVMMSGAYGITGVPAVVVNGKYRTSARQAGGFEEMLDVVDFLVAKERAAAGSP